MAKPPDAGTSRDPDLTEEAALTTGGFSGVAGVDEAGRGAWAGPLVAAAVILPQPGELPDAALDGLRDSKLLSHDQREILFERVVEVARAVGVGAVSADELDLLGLTAANELAMARAVRGLHLAPDFLLVDAFKLRSVPLPQRGIIRGDRRCLSIAAASVVAKVYRDWWLEGLGRRHAGYGFEQHRGYGVAAHQEAIRTQGLTAHRALVRSLARAAMPVTARQGLGRRGEELAARYLERQGMVVLERNVRLPVGEIDLVAQDADDLVVVEVKTRVGDASTAPDEAVSAAKLARLEQLAEAYVARLDTPNANWRIDVVAVVVARSGRIIRIDHLRGAFL